MANVLRLQQILYKEIFTVMHQYGSREWRKISASASHSEDRAEFWRLTFDCLITPSEKLQNNVTNVFVNPGMFLSRIPFGVLNPSTILTPVFSPSRPQTLVQKAFASIGTSPMFTSTPRRKGESHESKELSFPELQEKKTKVYLKVECHNKSINKELKDDNAVLGKAIVNESPQRNARAVLKNETLKKVIEESVAANDSPSKWVVLKTKTSSFLLTTYYKAFI